MWLEADSCSFFEVNRPQTSRSYYLCGKSTQMLKSMTGFGKATGTFQTKKVSVEIRSLNSKSIDVNARIASQYRELEPNIRKLVATELSRGKVDVSISIDSIGEESAVKLNSGLAKKYYEDLKSINDTIGETTTDYLPLILRMPDIFNTERESLTEEEKAWVLELVKEAADNLNNFRRKEGLELETEFQERITEIRGFLSEIQKYENERIEIIRERMKKGLEEIEAKSGHDDNRFEQEMIYYIEKLDVAEEKMRLSNHLNYFEETMKTPTAGKKLGFISQEIGREINTLGSKSNHAQMQVLVIGMKDNLEKIKEQILNTL